MKNKNNAQADLSASIGQSAADKLLNSIPFPFTLLHASTPPPGIMLDGAKVDDDGTVTLSEDTARAYLKQIAKSIDVLSTQSPDSDKQFFSEAQANLSEVIESAKAYLRAVDDGEKNKIPVKGPDVEYAKAILQGGIEGLYLKGVEFKAICSNLDVIAENKPNLGLNGRQISVSNSKITTRATGELWWYHPVFHCSMLCTHWSVTWKWSRIASVTVAVRVDLDAVIDISEKGRTLFAALHVNKLRLDYPVLRDIPLEGLANKVLANKQIEIFDASKFVACIPVINSRFAIESINIPQTLGSLDIEVNVKQL